MAYVPVATRDVQPDLVQPHNRNDFELERFRPHEESIFSQDTLYTKIPIQSEMSASGSTISQRPPRAPWIPYTLRWPFLTLMTVMSLGLCATTAALTGYSKRNQGLGNDDGSNGLLFAWRFTPTIIAVVYARLVGMVFNDFRRTEPFARMTKGPTSANASILQAPEGWWTMLAQAFSRKKNGGAINWALANVTTAFVLASLVISSISSSFLTENDRSISGYIPLQKKILSKNTPLQLKISPDMFLSTTGTLIYNLSVDPWTVGEYTVLPFWPEDSDPVAMLAASDHSGLQKWEATATVFRTEYRCNSMDTTISLNNTKTFSTIGYKQVVPLNETEVVVNGTAKMDTTFLLAEDGCQYQIDMAPLLATNLIDSLIWARAEDPLYEMQTLYSDTTRGTNTTESYIYVPGLDKYKVKAIGSDNPLLRQNSSAACAGKDIIHLSSELISSDLKSFRDDYTQKAWECALEITSADIPVTYSLSNTGAGIDFDRDEFAREQSSVGNDIINGSDVRQLLHQSNWLAYLNPAKFLADRSALLLSAEYQYNFDLVLSSTDVPRKAQSTMEAFFAALLQSSVSTSGLETQAIGGRSTLVKTRVDVFQGIGIALSAIYGVCALLLAVLAWQCTAHRRSLNLKSNPSTTAGVADIVSFGQWDKDSWKPLFIASTVQSKESFRSKAYSTDPKLREHVRNSKLKALDENNALDTNKSVHDWKPTTLRIPALVSLSFYLVLLAVSISVLYDFATGNRLYQNIFINQVEFGKVAGHITAITPFSIIPTFLAVLLGMWWDAIQQKFCQLQPFVTMTRPEGTHWKEGPGMHYSTTNWIKSVLRAVRNRHWLLTLVIIGNIMCQVFIITASALFARDTGYVPTDTRLNASNTLRRLPFVTEYAGSFVISNSATIYTNWTQDDDKSKFPTAELEELFGYNLYPELYWTEDSSWLYSATNEIVQAADEPAWSKDGWSFTPIKLPNTTENETISIVTPAIRARAVCSSTTAGYDISDEDTWLRSYDLTDDKIWNVSANPQEVQKGYYLDTMTAYSTAFFNKRGYMPFCSSASGEDIKGAIWHDWSGDELERFPYRFSQWPINFTATWIEGAAQSNFFTRDNFAQNYTLDKTNNELIQYDDRVFPFTWECPGGTSASPNFTMFTEIPNFQSVSCEPVIEVANSRATVSQDGYVESFELLDDPQPFDDPWKDVFVSYTHNSSDFGYSPGSDARADANRSISTSYGIYFLSSLLRAPEIGFENSDEDTKWTFSDLYPKANKGNSSVYFIRDDYSGMDLMSYCMYYLADKNATAFLTNTTLYSELVDKIFRTFFVHFVTGDANSTSRRAYQAIGAEMPDLGKKVVLDAKTGLLKQEDPETYPSDSTDTEVDAQMNRRVQLLKMNHVATWLSFALLVSLFLITIAILLLHRRFLSPLHRNVDCMADIMLLIAGSNHLLSLVKERGVQTLWEDDNLLVRLGWFRGDNGMLRWGIEVFKGDSNQAMEVVWEDGNESRTQSKWESVSTKFSSLNFGRK